MPSCLKPVFTGSEFKRPGKNHRSRPLEQVFLVTKLQWRKPSWDVCCVCWAVRAVGNAPVWYREITASRHRCRLCKAPTFNSTIHIQYVCWTTHVLLSPSPKGNQVLFHLWKVQGTVWSSMQGQVMLEMYFKIHILNLIELIWFGLEELH